MSRNYKRFRIKHLRRAIYAGLLVPVPHIFLTLPEVVSRRFARLSGLLAFWLLRTQRERALSNLRMAYRDEKGEEEIRQIARGVFINLALNMVEFCRISLYGPENIDRYVKAEGLHHIDDVLAQGKGGIYIGGHIGNWELHALYYTLKGYSVNVIARKIYIDALNKRLVKMRESTGMKILYRDRDQREMLRRLRQNEFIGILPDQEVRRIQGIFVDFFGRPCYTPVGPVALALHVDCPIVMGRLVRKGDYHLLKVDPPIYIEKNGSKEEIIRRYTALYTQKLEEFIREDPTQWVWIHRRWRTQPEDSPKTQVLTS